MKYSATMDEREIKRALSDYVLGKPGFEHGADVLLSRTPGDRPGDMDTITAHLTAAAYVQPKD